MSNQTILAHIRSLSFAPEITPLVELLARHADQIEFVTDHVHLKNVVFLAELSEEEAASYEYPYFGSFSFPNPRTSLSAFFTLEAPQILEKTQLLLSDPESVLYVEIGFVSSLPTQFDHFHMYQLLKQKKAASLQEAALAVKRFPPWYHAKPSRLIMESNQLMEKLEQADKRLFAQFKQDVKAQIDEAVRREDAALFHVLCKRLNMLRRAR